MKFKTTFESPYDQYQHFNGLKFEVVDKLTEETPEIDREVLPMYLIRLENGEQITAWPEEVEA